MCVPSLFKIDWEMAAMKFSFFNIWLLHKEYNLFRSEFYMWVPNLVKIDWEMAAMKFSFFDISISVRGDFPRIIEIAL